MTQNAGTYAFAASAGTVADNKSGDISLFLVLSSGALTLAQANAARTGAEASSSKTLTGYVAGGAAAGVSATGLAASKWWDAAAGAYKDFATAMPPGNLTPHLVARDAAGNDGLVSAASVAPADRTAPTVSGLAVTQNAGTYAFAASAGTVADNKSGNVTVCLVLSAAALAAGQLATAAAAALLDANQTGAWRTQAYVVGGAAVSLSGLSTDRHWTGSAFAQISETSPRSADNPPTYKLDAYLFARDEALNASSASTALLDVLDRTAPRITGTVSLAAAGSNAVNVSWAAGAIADGRGILSAAVYYSTSAPASTSAANVAAWKAAATTYTKSVASPATAFAAAGQVTVDGLSAATTYHAYLSVVDGGGNAGDFATTPASAPTTAAAPTRFPAVAPVHIPENKSTGFDYTLYSSQLVAHGQYAYYIPNLQSQIPNIKRYDHGTRAWSDLILPTYYTLRGSAIAVKPANGDLYVYDFYYGMHKWNGSTWSQLAGLAPFSCSNADMVATDQDVIYFAAFYVNTIHNIQLWRYSGSVWTYLGTAGYWGRRKLIAMHGTKVYMGYATAGTSSGRNSPVGMAEYDTATGVFTDRGAIAGTTGGYDFTVAASADGAYIAFPQYNVGATVYKLANGAYTLLGAAGFGGWNTGSVIFAQVSVDSAGGVYCTARDGKLYKYNAATNAWNATLQFATNPGSLQTPDLYAISLDTNMHHVLYREGTATTTMHHAVMHAVTVPVPSQATALLVATSLRNMASYSISMTYGAETPYWSFVNLPDFLVGVPMTRGMGWGPKTMTFDSGGIHAYGFGGLLWPSEETGVQVITDWVNGAKYFSPNSYNHFVYKYFANASFSITGRDYIWFFTRMPLSTGQALLNAP